MRLYEGQIVDGRYRLLSRIGAGGMADVWLADDPRLGREIALKVLHGQFAQDREFVERFRREAESAAGLQHPNVVSIFDRGQIDSTYYIAMQYLRGSTLADLIRGGLTTHQSIHIVREILQAAAFAHQHGVIHRDFKPQNVIIDEAGRVKVTDFGIARAGVSEITQSGSVMGTASYLPPEQAQGLPVTAESDIYSIGVILYECLTGRVPFHAESSVAVAMKHVSEEPMRPSAINPNVTPALDAVVMRALAKDPGQRFAGAEAFISALDAAEQDPGAGPGDTAAFAPLPPVGTGNERSRWWMWALGAAVIIGLALGLLATRDVTAEVPNVTNPFGTFLTLSEARAELEADGFEVEDVHRVERLVPRDTVLEQDPVPGTADKDCAFLSLFCSNPDVTLTVSAGPGRAEIPDVTGLEQAAAVRRLGSADFETEVEARTSREVDEGFVINTDPVPGSSAQRGSTVSVIVSSGPRMVAVPALIGLDEAAALARIEARGFTGTIEVEESEQPEGRVLSQAPNPGERVPVGTTVELVVSSGVETVAVPNLIGTSRPEAIETLGALGLDAVVAERQITDETEHNEVLEQSPGPDSEVREGDTVSLVVGMFEAPPDSGDDSPGTDTPESDSPGAGS